MFDFSWIFASIIAKLEFSEVASFRPIALNGYCAKFPGCCEMVAREELRKPVARARALLRLLWGSIPLRELRHHFVHGATWRCNRAYLGRARIETYATLACYCAPWSAQARKKSDSLWIQSVGKAHISCAKAQALKGCEQHFCALRKNACP